MEKYSRRNFLKSLGAITVAAFAGRSAFSSALFTFPPKAEDFNLLVVGDSLIWGQGLREEDKFYNLTKNWLEKEIFGGNGEINLKIKAHSGARISLHDYERTALEDAGKDGTKFYYPEINLSFPSIKTQIELARKSYDDPADVDLILLSGGVADITVSHILNPFKSNEELRKQITEYCFEGMSALLKNTAQAFPKALIAVVGYYPIITSHTPMKKIVNDVAETYDSPRWIKPLLNNKLSRQFFRRYRRKMINRSRIWYEGSTIELKKSVENLTAKHDTQRAVFIELPFKEENGYGAKNTLLWNVAKKGRGADDLYEERKIECRETIPALREKTNLKLRTRVCELAGIGHPNAAGAKIIAQTIAKNLQPFFQKDVKIN